MTPRPDAQGSPANRLVGGLGGSGGVWPAVPEDPRTRRNLSKSILQIVSSVLVVVSVVVNAALGDIKPDLIQQYRKQRGIQVGQGTVNRCLSLLTYLLNLAADPAHAPGGVALIDAVPVVKKAKEPHKVMCSVDSDEYRAIISNMGREQARVVIAWWESSMRHQEALDLKRPMVDFKTGLLRLPPEILKEKSPRRTPISYELRAVLEELKVQQSKVANLTGHVFTRKKRPADPRHQPRS